MTATWGLGDILFSRSSAQASPTRGHWLTTNLLVIAETCLRKLSHPTPCSHGSRVKSTPSLLSRSHQVGSYTILKPSSLPPPPPPPHLGSNQSPYIWFFDLDIPRLDPSSSLLQVSASLTSFLLSFGFRTFQFMQKTMLCYARIYVYYVHEQLPYFCWSWSCNKSCLIRSDLQLRQIVRNGQQVEFFEHLAD